MLVDFYLLNKKNSFNSPLVSPLLTLYYSKTITIFILITFYETLYKMR